MAKAKKIAPEKLTLQATKREVTGKKVKQMRKQGIIPANIFGPKFTSQSISMTVKDFMTAYKIAYETRIIYIALDKDSIPTLVRSVQRHPISNDILHVDFRKIDLSQKIETEVPIEIIGHSVAVNQLGGVLLKQHEHLLVEALPQDIPQHITVDISKITELGQEIKVADISKTANYTIKTDAGAVIVSVIAHKEESILPETTIVAPEITTEKPPEEGEASPHAGGASAKPGEAPAKESASAKATGDKPADKEKKPSKEEKKKE